MKLYKFGGYEAIHGNGTYHIVMAETKEDAVNKANKYQQRRIDSFPKLSYIKLYTIEDCFEHDDDVWEGEWD